MLDPARYESFLNPAYRATFLMHILKSDFWASSFQPTCYRYFHQVKEKLKNLNINQINYIQDYQGRGIFLVYKAILKHVHLTY